MQSSDRERLSGNGVPRVHILTVLGGGEQITQSEAIVRDDIKTGTRGQLSAGEEASWDWVPSYR